jgi:hypothetical protein
MLRALDVSAEEQGISVLVDPIFGIWPHVFLGPWTGPVASGADGRTQGEYGDDLATHYATGCGRRA